MIDPATTVDPDTLADDCLAIVGRAPNLTLFRVGKKATGALLDGREWRQMPELRQ